MSKPADDGNKKAFSSFRLERVHTDYSMKRAHLNFGTTSLHLFSGCYNYFFVFSHCFLLFNSTSVLAPNLLGDPKGKKEKKRKEKKRKKLTLYQ